MSETVTPSPAHRYPLFDSYGLPWTSSLSWYWLYLLTAVTGLTFAFALGIYLGIWLKLKGKGTTVLALYVILAVLAAGLIFVPDQTKTLDDILIVLLAALWVVAAFVLRRNVIAYYEARGGVAIRISPSLTALFSVCYINGCLRPVFPVDEIRACGRRSSETDGLISTVAWTQYSPPPPPPSARFSNRV